MPHFPHASTQNSSFWQGTLRIFTILFAFGFSALSVEAQYCVSGLYSSGCSEEAYIDGLSLAGYTQSATGCTGDAGIADYTGTTINVNADIPYSYSVTSGNGTEYANKMLLWYVDLNNDGDFEDYNEFRGYSAFGNTTFAGTVSFPGAGLRRMRVRLVWWPGSEPLENLAYLSCSSWPRGEAHDYMLNIDPSPNNECAQAIELTSSLNCVATQGTLLGATSSMPPVVCNSYTALAALDVWYKFTATHPLHIVQVQGSTSMDAVVDIRTGACNGSSIACADGSASGGQESVTFGTTIGVDYFVRIYHYYAVLPADPGFAICVTSYDSAPCDNSVPVLCGTPISTSISAGAGLLGGFYECLSTTSLLSGAESISAFAAGNGGMHPITATNNTGERADLYAKYGNCGPGGWTCLLDLEAGASGNMDLNISSGSTVYFMWKKAGATSSGTVDWTIGCPALPVEVIATAGTANAAYSTLGYAFAAINAGTHQGAITVNITGSINEIGPAGPSLAFLNSSGAGAASYTSVLIQPTGDNITVSGYTLAGGGLVELNGADNVTIDGDNPNTPGIGRNLTFTHTGGSEVGYTSVIRLPHSTMVQSSDNVTIRNCIINGNASDQNVNTAIAISGTAYTTYGILNAGGASTTSATINPPRSNAITSMPSGQTSTNFVVDNCEINRCGRGIALHGTAATVAPGLTITNNVIGDALSSSTTTVYYMGISAQGFSFATISGNTIRNIQSYLAANISAIDVGAISNGVAVSTNALVERNTITDVNNQNIASYGAYGINIAGGNTHRVQNNCVSRIFNSQVAGTGAYGSTYGAYGIRIAFGNNHKVYHNTVQLSGSIPGTLSTSLTAAFIITANTITGLDVRNNIFSNTLVGGNPAPSNGTHHACVWLPSGATASFGLLLNNNALYQGPTTYSLLAKVGSAYASGNYLVSAFEPSVNTPITNLRAYTSTLNALGTNDNASLAAATAAPLVGCGVDVSDPSAAALNGKGAAGTGVTLDLAGNLRSSPPDIGATEFNLVACSTADAGNILGTPSASPTATNILSLEGASTSDGISHQWAYGPVGGPHSNLLGTNVGQNTSTIPSGSWEVVCTTFCASCSPCESTTPPFALLIVAGPGGSITGPTVLIAYPPTPYSYTVYGYTGSPSFQWQHATTPMGPWTDIPVTTSGLYYTPSSAMTDHLRCMVTGGGCSVPTNVLSLASTIANDNVCNAATIGVGNNGPYTNSGASLEPGEAMPPNTVCSGQLSWCSAADRTVWFKFTAPASGRVSLNFGTTATWDSEIALWSAPNCSALLSGGGTLVAANEDITGLTPFHAAITPVCVIPGQTYYVQVDGFGANVNSAFQLVLVAETSLLSASLSANPTTLPYGGSADLTFSGTAEAAVTYTVNGGVPQSGLLAGGTLTVSTGPLTVATIYKLLTVTLDGCTRAYTGQQVQITVGSAPDCNGIPGGAAMPGTTCDDGDACTVNDVFTADCTCAGVVQDSDNDGTCDAEDSCPNDPQKTAAGECGCGVADVAQDYYADTDGDGYGGGAPVSGFACNVPEGFVANNQDCDDGNAAIHPNATEQCNGLDDDCDGSTDEGNGITAGLVGHWSFDGNLNDASGNGANATSMGGLVYATGVEGNINGSLQLGGGRYAVIQHAPQFNFGTGEFTYSVWLNWSTGGSYASVIDKAPYPQPGLNAFVDYPGAGQFHGRIDPSNAVTTTGSSLGNATWQHIVMTRSGTSLKVYVNGVLNSTSTATILNISNTVNMHLGRHSGSEIQFYQGRMDNLRLYNRALSAAEIAELFNGELIGNTSGWPAETCNGIDDNCNGLIDEGVELEYYADLDGDGFGAGDVSYGCTIPPGHVANNSDACPSDPDKQVSGACGCGAPDTDTDGDGIADCSDSCPGIPGQIGSPCDDGNNSTMNDQLAANCTCIGVVVDCDDNDPCTINDILVLNSTNQNFDGVAAPALPMGWTSAGTGEANNWFTATDFSVSASNCVKAVGTGSGSDYSLSSPTINISGASAQLTFQNKYSFEGTTSPNHYDGGVLEISINGLAWVDILAAGGSFAAGGYNGTITSAYSNILGGRAAWVAVNMGWPASVTTTVNLPAAAAGKPIQLRWRFASDAVGSSTGWWLDDIVTSDIACQGTPLVAPTASITGGGEVCSLDQLPNVEFTFTGPAPYTFTYSGPSGHTETNWPSTTYTITNAAAGTYEVTALGSEGGCTGSSLGVPVAVSIITAQNWYADIDGDGFGAGDFITSCSIPPGYVINNGDNCPSDPDKQASGTCGCGVPDTDTDGDGVADCLDSCPGVPGQLGSPCDDGNPMTSGETIQAECNCGGGTDCNGDVGGTAYLDNCSTCVGGDTGLEPCVADCDGEYGGDAYLDGCGTCVGGNTGLNPCTADCNGVPGGTALPGTACDDGNSTTFNDVLGIDCICLGAPANDNICGAIPLAFGLNGPFSNVGATLEAGEPTTYDQFDCWNNWCSLPDRTVWFSFVAPASGRVSLDFNNQSPEDSWDSQIALWSASDCNAMTSGEATLLQARDKYASFLPDAHIYPICLIPGQTYYVQVDDGWEGNGAFQLRLIDEALTGTIDAQPSEVTIGAEASVVFTSNENATVTYSVDGGTPQIGILSGQILFVNTGPLSAPVEYELLSMELDGCITNFSGQSVTITIMLDMDCNGVAGGSAFLDECGTCVSGNTGLIPCVADCNGDFGGTASLDNCGVCTGGSTGVTACVADCNGDFGGTALLDNCGICAAGNTGVTACAADCNGVFGGTASLDNCGVCTGGTTGLTACVADCNGDFGGAASLDNCGTCTGGNTGLIACVADCNGVFGGTASLDNCGTCTGGNTGATACVADCNGVFGGTAYLDGCSTCVGGNTGATACVSDCNGVLGGNAYLDNCNTCVGGSTGLTPCIADCNGVPGGTAYLDNCSICVGGNTGLTACVQDCNAIFGGTAAIDLCGTCAGGNTGIVPNSGCLDCAGVPNGTRMIDSCGNCLLPSDPAFSTSLHSLSYSSNAGFSNSLIDMQLGSPSGTYTVEVVYTNSGNEALPIGWPRAVLDFEGNGIFTNPLDRTVLMTAVDPADNNTADGKLFRATILGLAAGTTWQTRIVTQSGNCMAEIGPFSYPDVLNAPDVAIYASDISFSNNNPAESSPVAVTAIVRNQSAQPAQNVSVSLVNQFDPGAVYPVLTIGLIDANSTASVVWNIITPAVPAWCPMQVMVDAGDAIAESNELNNSAIRPFTNGNFNVPGAIVITATANPADAYQGTTTSVMMQGRATYSGTAVPLPDNSVAGATVTVHVVGGGTYTGLTNATGHYSVSVPANGPLGLTILQATTTDYTLTSNTASTNYTQYPSLVCIPDLRAEVLFIQGSIVAGQGASGILRVRNLGCAATTENTLLDVTQTGGEDIADVTVPPLAPGALFESPFSALFTTAGSFTVCATADGSFIVEEESENNTACASIEVQADAPDLSPGYMDFGSTQLCLAQSTVVTIANGGASIAAASSAEIIVRRNGALEQVFTQPVGAIAANGSSMFTLAYTYPGAGVYTFEVKCDVPLPNGVVAESNETNNTAIFTHTIVACKPDLDVVSCGLVVDPVDPSFPGMVEYKATVRNVGTASVNGPIDVEFNVSGQAPILGQITGTLAPNSEVVVTVSAASVAPATATLTVKADPADTLDELSEANNSASGSLCVELKPESICGDYSNFWQVGHTLGETTQLRVGLKSLGLYRTAQATVRFEVSGPGIAGTALLGDVTVNNMDPTCGCPVILQLPTTFLFNDIGTYTFTMTADPLNTHAECNEGNNTLVRTVQVSNLPDLRVLSQYIAPSLLNPDIGEAISFGVTYDNLGASDLGDVFDLAVDVDNVPFATVNGLPGILSGTDNTTAIPGTWSSSLVGAHVVRARVDAGNAVPELNEANNEATRTIVVGPAANLYFVTFSPNIGSPPVGTGITIQANIGNGGDVPVNAQLQFYYVNSLQDTLPIGTAAFAVAALGSTPVQMPWTVQEIPVQILGVVNNVSVLEFNQEDNEASFLLNAFDLAFVSVPGCAGGADGSLTASADNGVAPYTYVWSNGASGSVLNAQPGSYTVSVTDAEGRFASAAGVIGVDPNCGLTTDCNGVLGGTAYLDNCNTCVGGNTGVTACVADCNGDFGGTASLDNCGVCTGGNTGATACAADCNGDFGGTASLDNCGVCTGGNTGATACVADCNGDFGGTVLPGTACDDNDPLTANDVFGTDCRCAGQFIDCLGQIGGSALPGNACNDNDPSTVNDVYGSDCQCTGIPAAALTTVVLELRSPNGTSDQISWEVITGSDEVVCSGGSYPASISEPITELCSLPDGCYRLRVFDSANDGFGTAGGYQLRLSCPPGGTCSPTDIRIIDDLGNFSSGGLSTLGNGPSTFCLPMATSPKPILHLRDKVDFVSGTYLVCEPDAAVSAQWQVGDQTLSGYQFWFFDPNGGFSYRRGRNHATSDGFGNIGATRACHMKINNWAVANQIPENVLMNVRIRTRVNGVYGDFGPAYRFKIDATRAACPLTQLNDTPDNVALSCNQTRPWGAGNWIWARPISGANKYQFRFRIASEGFNRVITSSTYFVQLNWATQPLLAGKSYAVDVRASKDGGATWCTAAIPPALTAEWGVMCSLSIIASNAQEGSQNLTLDNDDSNLTIYPNPNQGDQLFLSIDAIDPNVGTVSLNIYDLTGQRTIVRTFRTQDGQINSHLDLNGLAAGVYIVHITAGEKVYTDRLVVTQ